MKLEDICNKIKRRFTCIIGEDFIMDFFYFDPNFFIEESDFDYESDLEMHDFSWDQLVFEYENY